MNVIQMLLEFVPKGPIYNKSTLVQVKAWLWIDGKPLPELLVTHYVSSLGYNELTFPDFDSSI